MFQTNNSSCFERIFKNQAKYIVNSINSTFFMSTANNKLSLSWLVLQHYFTPKICVLNKLPSRAKLMSS